MQHEHESPCDPLGLDAVDRAIRINELREQASDLGLSTFHTSDDCPADAEEGFLQSIVDYESAPVSSRFEQLTRDGIDLPPPGSLDDDALTAKLWEVIRALAERDVFLSRTDHLSDRELYAHLWGDSLREEGPIMPPGSGWICHFDLLGGCSEEDLQNSLRYYDSEEDRQRWAKEFPGDVIPPHEDPPFDRDRLLPNAEPEPPESDD